MSKKQVHPFEETLAQFRKLKKPGETLIDFILRPDRPEVRNPAAEVERIMATAAHEIMDLNESDLDFNISEEESHELNAEWERFIRTGILV